ncbi:Hypothetical predicted protein [Lynx pardinus]|uniref:Uncharacterized protein n=1 Tax=Lynx pardinus TaxID=191816 RepID=A0A485PG95_LYNPA|nr:Hypothetical predicted protein [Lynx pardinus]
MPNFQGMLHTHFIHKWEIQGEVHPNCAFCLTSHTKKLCGIYQYVTAKETVLNAEPVLETFVILGLICDTELHFRAGNETTVLEVNLEFQVTSLGAAVIILQLYI